MDSTWWTKPEQLDEKQQEVIALPEDESYLIKGPPGCGKTNLLVLRATQLYKIKVKNFVVLTLGRVLKEFLVTGSANYPFPNDKIQTYVGWANAILQSNGYALPEGDFETVRSQLLATLLKISNKNISDNRLDYIFIDEAQDYSADEIEVICSFADKVFAVGDSRQNIYSQSGGLEALSEIVSDVITLEHHYRSGPAICRVADGIVNKIDADDSLELSSNYDDVENPSSVEPYPNLKLASQLIACLDNLKTQLRAYPEGFLGVLCPRLEELRQVSEFLCDSEVGQYCQSQLFESGYTPLNIEKRIIVTTIHGAKGLEFRALHLIAMETVKKFKTQKKMSYTAVTRAKTSLSIYCHQSLPGYLEKGLDALLVDAEVEHPSLADLFDKG